MATSGCRRQFLRQGMGAAAFAAASPLLAAAGCGGAGSSTGPDGTASPTPSPVGFDTTLPRRLFSDLERHFIFEYFPWYGGPPGWEHWRYLERQPPLDIASSYLPALGPYDVRERATLEQHARWIKEAHVGAVALSWWGRNSFENRAVSSVLDVLAAHDLKATFALESYADDRARRYPDDVVYLLREYGEKRRFDALLMPKDASGRSAPVFKSFRTVLPETSTSCLGVTTPIPDYTPDDLWRRQTDSLRNTLRADYDGITLLADSLAYPRARAAGFDGIGLYDNFLEPAQYRAIAEGASGQGLVFSLHVNPGYDSIEPRHPSDPCYSPRAFAPPTPGLDFGTAAGRELAARAATGRIEDSWTASLRAQLDPSLENRKRGFLIVFINSWNEWHEGHAFEPMRDAGALGADEQARGFHNPAQGDYRLQKLASLQRMLL